VVAAVTDISEAIAEQSSAAQSIAQQVEAVARLSEVNNLTAKETEAVSLDPDRLSTNLRDAVEKFRV
jgi:methyl-accepting chemotaxis protein